MFKKMREKNIDLIIVFILAILLIIFLPDLTTKLNTPTKKPNDHEVKPEKISDEVKDKILQTIGYSYMYLDNSYEITDKEVLNKDYKEKPFSILHLESVKKVNNAYVVVVQALFRNKDIIYYDKDQTVRAGLLKSEYDFNSTLFKDVTGLWEYKYRIDQETYEILSFKVTK